MKEASRREGLGGLLGLVALCLFVSGTGSLMLEVVWSRLLKLVFGSTTLAISTILVAYMAGLGFGGLLGGRLAPRSRNGIRAYALMEIGIGLYALAVPYLLDLYPLANRYLFSSWDFWPAALGRFTLALIALLLPTLLMGATLPFLVRAVVERGRGLARGVGLLYGVNTLGAVFGVVLATFVLFPTIGVYWTNVAGALADLGVGVIALALLAPRLAVAGVRGGQETPMAREAAPPPPEHEALPRWNVALLAYALVGFTSLTYEVAWTRALSMIVGSSVYAFATMLAAFLTGIALGSLFGRYWFDRLRNPLAAYAAGMGLLGVASFGTLLMLARLHDLFVYMIEHWGMTASVLFVGTVTMSFLAMIAPTLVLGALFPLLTRGLAAEGRHASSTVGDVYFVNTVGSAAGAFSAGFLLIPLFGLRNTIVGGIVVNLLAGALLLVWQRQRRGLAPRLAAAALAMAAVVLVVRPPAWDAEKLSQGPFFDERLKYRFGIGDVPLEDYRMSEMLFYEEGLNTTVSVHETLGQINMRVNGKVDASIGDMETQVISGILPLLFGGPADDVLVIGYASGVTVGSASLLEPRKIDVIELEESIMEASRWFEDINHRPLEKENVEVIVEDGRTWLAYTDRTYDVIVSEPSNPWITGASNLFTREFLASARERLAPGGRLLQWLQLYGLDPDGVESVIAAVSEEFPHVYGFISSDRSGDLLMLASLEPLTADHLPRFEVLPEAVREDLKWVGVYSTADLWSLLRLDDDDIRRIAAGADTINSDDNMFVELRAPWHLYDSIDASQGLLAANDSGILPILEGSQYAEDPGLMGTLAISYLRARRLPDLAVMALAMAREAGESASTTIAEAELGMREGTGDVGLLLARYERAVELEPQACVPRLYRSPWRLRLGNPSGALEDLDVAKAACAGDPRVSWGRMRALMQLGRFGDAYAEARQLVRQPITWRQEGIWIEAAEVAARAGELEQAAEWTETYLERTPYDPVHWQTLSELYRRLGWDDRAEIAARNAGLAAANRIRVMHRSALAALQAGDLDRAREMIDWVLEREPENERARRDRERILEEPAAAAETDEADAEG
jgi:spermidine synthase